MAHSYTLKSIEKLDRNDILATSRTVRTVTVTDFSPVRSDHFLLEAAAKETSFYRRPKSFRKRLLHRTHAQRPSDSHDALARERHLATEKSRSIEGGERMANGLEVEPSGLNSAQAFGSHAPCCSLILKWPSGTFSQLFSGQGGRKNWTRDSSFRFLFSFLTLVFTFSFLYHLNDCLDRKQ